MGDRFRTSRAISGDLLDEIEQVAEQVGTTPETMIADMRQAWKQLQQP